MIRLKRSLWLLPFGFFIFVPIGSLGQIPHGLSSQAAGLGTSKPAAPGASAAPSVSPPPAIRAAERLANLPGLSNVGKVAPGIYRGAQPDPNGYATLRDMGIRTVINLRARHGEKAAVESRGMRSIEVPIQITKKMDARRVRRVIALMTDRANQPVFVHCAQGKDRTGIVVAAYRMEIDGWTNAEAEAEMQAFGFNDVWVHLTAFVRQYRPAGTGERRGDAEGKPAGR